MKKIIILMMILGGVMGSGLAQATRFSEALSKTNPVITCYPTEGGGMVCY